MNNHRDAAAEAAILSARTGASAPPEGAIPGQVIEEEAFNFDKIPLKIPRVKPHNADGISLVAFHSEAPYSIRKILLEHAKKHIKELEKAEANFVTSLINHSS